MPGSYSAYDDNMRTHSGGVRGWTGGPSERSQLAACLELHCTVQWLLVSPTLGAESFNASCVATARPMLWAYCGCGGCVAEAQVVDLPAPPDSEPAMLGRSSTTIFGDTMVVVADQNA